MKIATFGNCQSIGMAHSIQRLLPDAEVFRIGVVDVDANDPTKNRQIQDRLKGCDLVFLQSEITRPKPKTSFCEKAFGMSVSDFIATLASVAPFPYWVFRGMHPDCVYLGQPDGSFVRGPVGPYQSAITFNSFQAGLPEHRAIALFNRYTYCRLGYASANLQDSFSVQEANEMGFDIKDFLSGQRGCFMHTINHPKIELIFEIAKQALTKAGLEPDKNAKPPPDVINGFVWPVYPTLAPGISEAQRGFQFRRKKSEDINLEEFVSESYRCFATAHDAKIAFVDGGHIRRFFQEEVLV